MAYLTRDCKRGSMQYAVFRYQPDEHKTEHWAKGPKNARIELSNARGRQLAGRDLIVGELIHLTSEPIELLPVDTV